MTGRALAAAVVALACGAAQAAELELSHGHEVLSGGRASWRATALELSWGEPGGAGLGAGVRELERFDLRDVDLSASAHAPLGDRWDAGLEASASPSHRFAPLWSGGARVAARLGGGFVASLGARGARYEAADARATTGVGSGGLERYFGRQRLALTSSVATVDGAWSASQRAEWNLFYGERGRVGVGASAGRELESVGGGRVLSTRVLAASVAGAHPLAREWAVVWELGVQRQGDLYTRSGGRLGLRRRF